MMATPHMVAGAAIGRVLRRPWLAYPAAFASHFLLDFVPHIDSHALFGANHGGPTPLEAAAGVTDFLIGALVVGLVAARQPARRARSGPRGLAPRLGRRGVLQGPRGVMIGSALFGILIDLAEYVPPFGPWFQHWAGTAWLAGFHHRIQHNLTPAHWGLGAVTQVAALGLGLVVCLAGRKSTPRTASARVTSV